MFSLCICGARATLLTCGISRHKGENWKLWETSLWFCVLDFFLCVDEHSDI